jgi:GxxExxY protein
MNHENHEDHEQDKNHQPDQSAGEPSRLFTMRLRSPLSAEAERAMTETIGCAIAVHRELGPGFLESIYKKAMYIEMKSRSLAFECERAVTVNYRGVDIRGQRVDLIVENQVVVELKAVRRMEDVHRAQVISYLKTTKMRAGLLINFRVPVLKQGLQRVVL